MKGNNLAVWERRVPQVYLASQKILNHSLMIKSRTTKMKFKKFTRIGKPKKLGLVIEEVSMTQS